jgi:hypothetical protein|tara:strand:- start:77 stop:421 length:345 start_codon:yes stop_codon:yes gene_type:complete
MSFFESEVVRAELAEVSELQEEVYTNLFKFPTMSKEDQRYHIDVLERLLEKQRVLYTRLSLSDDPEAKKMKDKVLDSAKDLGLPANIDMNIFFKNMNEMVEVMRREIDNKDSLS